MRRWTHWILAVTASSAMLPQLAQAQHRGWEHERGWRGDVRHFEAHDMNRWRTGFWRHGHHEGRLGWWWVAGGAWYFYPRPVYPFPDPYLPTTVVVQQQVPMVVTPSPVVTVPSTPLVNAAPPQVWYFCEAANSYYPYVPSCPGGWKTVLATPPVAPPPAPSGLTPSLH